MARLEADRMTVAIANGLVIANSRDAMRSWLRSRESAQQSPAQFHATLGRLAAAGVKIH